MSREEWIELNRNTLENLYNELYMEYVTGKDEGLERLLYTYEAALEDMGILEEDVPFEDDIEANHWDEWMLDNEIDRAMEDEYEDI